MAEDVVEESPGFPRVLRMAQAHIERELNEGIFSISQRRAKLHSN